MKQYSEALYKALASGYELAPSVKATIEWNQNRYATIATTANDSTEEEYDESLFPISSIVEPLRPKRGLMKARTSSTLPAEGYLTDAYRDAPGLVRFYTASEDDKYHYWTSPTISASDSTITDVNPYVTYEAPVKTNKLQITVENSVSDPVDYDIQITNDGTTWETVASSLLPDDDGRVILFLQDDSSWSQVEEINDPVEILGIKLVVREMDQPFISFNLIELSPRLIIDVSDYLQSWSAGYTQAEVSLVVPIGQVSSNESTIVLANVDGMFNKENPDSPYAGLIDSNALVTLDLGIDTTRFGGSGVEWTRQLTMYTTTWNGQDQDAVELPLVDGSVFLQEIKPNKMFLQDVTLGEAVWRMCDSVGFNDYNYDISDKEASQIIPFFWTTGDLTVWEEFNGLAPATQTAIFFDEYGILQILTRTQAYDETQAIKWTLDAEPVTAQDVSDDGRPAADVGKLPDIQTLEHTYQYEANKVEVTYKPTSLGDDSSGVPAMQVVWEPEDTVVLRAAQLIEPMSTSSTTFKMSADDSKTWPHTGVIQVEGEFIRYGSKEYQYYDGSGVLQKAYIKSLAEQKEKDRLNEGQEWRNTFTGNFGDLERGIWNTSPAAHVLDANGYLKRVKEDAKTAYIQDKFFIYNKNKSTVTLSTNWTFGQTAWYTASRGAKADDVPYYYGTRLMFPSGGSNTYAAAGLVISLGNQDAGFYCEIVRSDKVNRSVQHELNFYVKTPDGKIKRHGPDGGKGIPIAIASDTWVDLDVAFRWDESDSRLFSIMINGGQSGILNVSVPAGEGIGEALGGRFGIFTRGYTRAEFEYLYAITWRENSSFDRGEFFDRIRGGWSSGQWDREWTYGYKSVVKRIDGKNKLVHARYGSRLFDEFGPIVHEVREYTVDFTKSPVLYSSIYCSNDSQVIAPNYYSGPFGASFMLANASRDDAIAKGTDSFSTAGEGDIEQTLLVYGRVVTQDEDKTYSVQNDAAIRRRGEVQVGIANQWIQTEEFAKALGDWINDHWSNGCDEISVTSFGNPLIQLADLVAVNYPLRSMYRNDQRYVVTAVSHQWDNGLQTQLTLRRVQID